MNTWRTPSPRIVWNHLKLVPVLLFAVDPGLPETAIVAIEIWPELERAVTRGELILPVATPDLITGKVIKVVATAYSSSVGETDSDPFTTASGTRVKQGTLAANFLPSWMYFKS